MRLIETQQPDLAEIIAATQISAHHFASRHRLRDAHHAGTDQVKRVRLLALLADDLALIVRDQLDLLFEIIDELVPDRGEKRDAAQMSLERAFAIFLVHLHFEGGAFERRHLYFRSRLRRVGDLAIADQHVEDHAQHFHHHARFARDDRGRARLKSAAGHFAEKLARPELRDRLVHGQIDVGVDPDEFPLVRLRALVVPVVDEKTLHPRDAPSEESPAGFGAQVGERIVDRNIHRARDDVIRGRAELAFGADRFAFAVAMKHGRAFRPVVQLPARDFLQRRQVLDQLIDAERLSRS